MQSDGTRPALFRKSRIHFSCRLGDGDSALAAKFVPRAIAVPAYRTSGSGDIGSQVLRCLLSSVLGVGFSSKALRRLKRGRDSIRTRLRAAYFGLELAIEFVQLGIAT